MAGVGLQVVIEPSLNKRTRINCKLYELLSKIIYLSLFVYEVYVRMEYANLHRCISDMRKRLSALNSPTVKLHV